MKFVFIGSGCCNQVPQTGVDYKQKFISHSPEGWKSEIRMIALLGSGEGCL